jgi:hypothetical protein
MSALFGPSQKTKVLRIDQIEIDDSIYPRKSPDWITSYKYANSMRAGVVFPPITVARIDGKIKLVDGYHRIQANKTNKIEHIEGTVLEGLTKEQAFLKSIEMNIAHGQPLNVADRVRVIVKLKELNYPMEKISQIVHIPVNKVESFVANRVTTTTIGSKPLVLPTSVTHLSHESPIKESESYITQESSFPTSHQIQVFKGAVKLLENPKFVRKDDKTLEVLKTLKTLLDKYLKGK